VYIFHVSNQLNRKIQVLQEAFDLPLSTNGVMGPEPQKKYNESKRQHDYESIAV